MLDKRLRCVADMVRPGSRLADIGTDHAYLPTELVSSGRCPHAIACDIRPGPADAAQRTVREAGLTERIEVRLGNGLAPLHWAEADDIVIAGMGGETIAAILRDGVPRWLPEGREALKRMSFLLQPMSRPEELRRMLLISGFSLFEEKTVEQGGHLYTIMRAGYTEAPPCTDEASYYIGALPPKDGAAFLQKQRMRLARRADGLRLIGGSHEEWQQINGILRAIDRYLEKE